MKFLYKIVACSVMAVVVAAVLLYRFCPDRAVGGYIEQAVSSTVPGLCLEIGNLSFSFPLGIKADSILATWEKYLFDPVRLERFESVFDIKTIFSSDRQVSYSSRIYGGNFTGRAVFHKSRVDTIDIYGEFTGQDPASILNTLNSPALRNAIAECRGPVAGSFQAVLDNGRINFLKGALSSGRLTLASFQALPLLQEISFLNVAVLFETGPSGTIQIKACNLTGESMDVELSGTIQPAAPLAQSGLNLSVAITVHQQKAMAEDRQKRCCKVLWPEKAPSVLLLPEPLASRK